MAAINTRKRGSKWEWYFEAAKMGGKRQRFSKGGYATKTEAMQAGAQAFHEYQNAGTVIVPADISVYDYMQFWIEAYCIPNLKPSTVANYRKYIRLHILPAIGKYRLVSVSAEQLQKLINDMVAAGYSRNTVTGVKGILSNSMNYAVQPLHYIKASPMAFVKIPKGSRSAYKTAQYEREVIEESVIRQIFERFQKGSTTYLPLIFAYHCGMRLGEAFAVTWDNVDFDGKTVTINKQLQWDDEKKVWYLTPPKYNSVRTIGVDSFVLELLDVTKYEQDRARAYYAEYYTTIRYNEDEGINEHDGEVVRFVNTYENGGFIQPRTIQHTCRVIHQFYPKFTFHALRHTHCTRLLEAGAPIKYVQERLGHKDVKVTLDVYNHLTQNQTEQGNEILERMFE